MEHFYKGIKGWFSFPKLYTEMVKRFDSKSNFVEIGTYKGRSASYMAVEIINSDKDIAFYCVDTWLGSDEHKKIKSVIEDTLYDEFLNNTKSVSSIIKPIRSTSIKAANYFEDGFFDFIFIDASHDYDNVKNDLKAWFPKLKSTGVFAGHDYVPCWRGVQQAVDEFVTEQKLKLEKQERCWVIRDLAKLNHISI